MDRLWAPWRIGYVTDEKPSGCIFCQKGEEAELLILYQNPLIRILLNRYPYTNGHLLVAPVRHLGSLDLVTPQECQELFRGAVICQTVLQRSSEPDGFNVGLNLGKAAGAGVEDHLHLHVVPRWNGDTNFMAVVADVRVLPEAIRSSYDRLLPIFAQVLEEEHR